METAVRDDNYYAGIRTAWRELKSRRKVRNRDAADLLGVSEAELLARWLATALSGQPLTTTWLLGEKMLSVTVRRVQAYGTPSYAAMFVQEMQAPSAAQQDEPQRATVVKDLETAQIRARLIERILHEFRNPLAAVASSAEILERYGQSMTNDRREKHVARIGEEIHRLSEILDNILTLFS